MARRQINLKVLDDGTRTFEVRHRWEDRPVAPPPDGTPTEYLPFRQQRKGLPGSHGRPEWLKAKVPGGEGYQGHQGHHARPRAAHRLRRGPLPEHRRVLEQPHGDVHDPRQRLHPLLRLLRRPDRQAARRSTSTSPTASPTPPSRWASSTPSSPASTATSSPTGAPRSSPLPSARSGRRSPAAPSRS